MVRRHPDAGHDELAGCLGGRAGLHALDQWAAVGGEAAGFGPFAGNQNCFYSEEGTFEALPCPVVSQHSFRFRDWHRESDSDVAAGAVDGRVDADDAAL